MFEVLTKLVEAAELVLHLVFHPGDTLLNSLHFFVDPSFERSDLFEVSNAVLLFDSKLGSGHLSVVCLALFKAEIFAHLIVLSLTREALLAF